MDKQFKEWWEKASKTLKCDQYDAYEIWQQAQKVAVPEGFVLVPREPTENILNASRRRQWDELSSPMEDMDYLKYKAMIKEGEFK